MNCPICEGPGIVLGVLGTLKHFSCRNCGMQFSKRMKPRRKRPPQRVLELMQDIEAIDNAVKEA
jgi:transposase-like protein